MKRLILISFVGLIAALCIAAEVRRAPRGATPGNNPAAEKSTGKLIVHEWGTFTGFAGSDGVHLPFNTIYGSDLPGFVSNRQKEATRLNPQLMDLLFVKGGGAPALQRMETPVMYFYADAPAQVQVRVDFPHGLLTEFYPPVQKLGPRYGKAYGEYAALAPLPKGTADPGPQTQPSSTAPTPASFLDWGQVSIVPNPTADQTKQIPEADANHYRFARDTDSALVQVTDADGKLQTEKFLFYRGLGNFSLPVTLTAQGGDHFELHNSLSGGWYPNRGDHLELHAIPAAFLIDVDGKDPASVRFARFDNLPANQVMKLPAGKAAQRELARAIEKSLIANGLYEKEASAMVETWKSSWLAEPGTRLLYIVPRTVTDAMLPVRITPTPAETVRVMVGRIDVLTPEAEARLKAMLAAASPTAILPDEDARMLKDLGRFFEPALQRASNLAGYADGKQADLLWKEWWFRK